MDNPTSATVDARILRLSVTCVVVALLLGVIVLAFGSGCGDCAEYGEYCVDIDCCEDLVCRFVDNQGYRCR